ncbi:hypothetical protein Unana1_01945 [Umbelopsis nana]
MDLRNGPPSDYHQPPLESKQAQPDRDNTYQQQDLASHGVATDTTDQRNITTHNQDTSEKVPTGKQEDVKSNIGASDRVVDGYLDKKMGGANF